MTLRHGVFSSLNYIITILSGLRLSYAKTFSVYTCDHLDFCFMFCASSQKSTFFFLPYATVFILFFLFDVYIMFILLQINDVPQASCGSPHMLVSLFINIPHVFC